MLGKRFRRTTSMSQLGPERHTTPTAASEEIQGMLVASNTVSSVPHKAARPLMLQEDCKRYQIAGRCGDAQLYGDANMGDVVEGGFSFAQGGSSQYQDVEGRIGAVYGDAAGVRDMAPGFDPGQDISDAGFTESPRIEAHGENPPFQVHPPASLVPFQMGLWIGYNKGLCPYLAQSSGHGKLESAAESISPVDFLDVCFFCKRRLRHERDIFIYRGDTAFCSEECRHRQILSDERHSLTRDGSRKRGAGASETAVAA